MKMAGLPKTLVVRTDVEDPKYQEAVKDILFERGGDLHPKLRATYYYKEDRGRKLAKLDGIAKKLGVEASWKVFDFMSPMSQKFLENNTNYKSLDIDYDFLPNSTKSAESEKPKIPAKLAAITNSRPVSPFTDPHFYDDYEPGNR